jgi:hypothetical protein
MAGGKADSVTPFDNEQAHRIAKLAAAYETFRFLRESYILPVTASLQQVVETNRDLALAVLEAEGRQS